MLRNPIRIQKIRPRVHPRPRRGGLFEGLKVWEDAQMREQQGKRPVIFLTVEEILPEGVRETEV